MHRMRSCMAVVTCYPGSALVLAMAAILLRCLWQPDLDRVLYPPLFGSGLELPQAAWIKGYLLHFLLPALAGAIAAARGRLVMALCAGVLLVTIDFTGASLTHFVHDPDFHMFGPRGPAWGSLTHLIL